MSNYHNSCVTNILLKHWENHYLEIVKAHSGPETGPSSLLTGAGSNLGRIGIGNRIRLGQNLDRNRTETASGLG